MQELGPYLAACLVAALFAMYAAWKAVGSALALDRALSDYKRMRDQLLLVEDRLDTIHLAIRRTEGRVVKQNQRAKAPDPEAEPDPKLDPDGWKQWQNRKLAMRGRLQ